MDSNTTIPVILIGPVSDDPAESVSAINRTFITGLQDRYQMRASCTNRRHGSTRQSKINLWNLYYLIKHSTIWIGNLLRYRPDVAHYAISAGWALEKSLVLLWFARLLGARTVGHLHSGGFPDFWETLSPRRKRFASGQLRRLDSLVVLSDGWRERVWKLVGISPDKLFVVNNPINPDFEAAALQMPIERQRPILLALGVIGRDKGVFELIEAVALARGKVPDFTLQLAGPEREPGILKELESQLEHHSLGDCVQILPSVWGEAKLELFRHASVFLLPSHFENFPLVILEAAAAGHAIVATPVGATPEFFEDHESALFVKVEDSHSLVEAIVHVINDSTERQRLAKNAREVFCSKLARARIMASLDAVYRATICLN